MTFPFRRLPPFPGPSFLPLLLHLLYFTALAPRLTPLFSFLRTLFCQSLVSLLQTLSSILFRLSRRNKPIFPLTVISKAFAQSSARHCM